MVKSDGSDTRDRLIASTLDLVAAHGFDGVSVGDIEAGAGLAPRSGALYKYFDSKLAVLEAGLEQHLASVDGIERDLADAPLDDATAEVDVMARWLLAELDRERTITHVIEREGDRLPDLRDRMRAGISDRGYRIASAFVDPMGRARSVELDRRRCRSPCCSSGALINFRRSTWTFGARPLGLDDDRLVEVFVSVGSSLLNDR